MKQRPILLFLLPLIALALVAGALVHPSSAHAAAASKVLKSQPHIFWAKGHAPKSGGGGGGGNLIYHGGPVVAGEMKAYAIFWEPKGSFVGSTYNKLLTRYFGDIGGSPLYENNEQYTDTSGKAPTDAQLEGTFVDRTPYPTTPFLLDSAIQNEVAHAMSVKGWKPAINHAFFVYTALNEFICITTSLSSCSAPFGGGFCAYHSVFGTVDAPVIYAAMPYDGNALAGCYNLKGSPNHNAAADAETSTTSHEQIEIATDPLLDAWFDSTGLSGEIGDKCAYVYGPLKKNGANVTFNGHQYVVQSEWDNKVSGCVLSGP
jgi:hypothetical protein